MKYPVNNSQNSDEIGNTADKTVESLKKNNEYFNNIIFLPITISRGPPIDFTQNNMNLVSNTD